MTDGVVENPEIALPHDDGLPRDRERGAGRATQNQVKTITHAIVGTSVDMRENSPMRAKRDQEGTPERAVKNAGNMLAVAERLREAGSDGGDDARVDIVDVEASGQDRGSGSTQEDAHRLTVRAKSTLATRVKKPRVRRPTQLRAQ